MTGENKEINILHLSDLHCGIEQTITREADLKRRKKALEGFFDCFNKQVPKNWMPDLVVISGDLGWQGSEGDYKRNEFTDRRTVFTTEEFIIKLKEVTKLSGSSIICCPGNHDKKQKKVLLLVEIKSERGLALRILKNYFLLLKTI